MDFGKKRELNNVSVVSQDNRMVKYLRAMNESSSPAGSKLSKSTKEYICGQFITSRINTAKMGRSIDVAARNWISS